MLFGTFFSSNKRAFLQIVPVLQEINTITSRKPLSTIYKSLVWSQSFIPSKFIVTIRPIIAASLLVRAPQQPLASQEAYDCCRTDAETYNLNVLG